MSRAASTLAVLTCLVGPTAEAAPEAPPARVQATITWTSVPGATFYQLEIARDPAFEDVVHRATPARPRHAWTTAEGVVSYLRVRGIGSGGRKSPWSPPRIVELQLVAPEPRSPAPDAEHVLSAGPLGLEAAPSRFVAVFRFQLSKDQTFQEVAFDRASKTGQVVVEAAAPGAWYWRVGGEDGFGNQLPFSRPLALTVLAARAPRAAPRPGPPPPPDRAEPSILELPPPEVVAPPSPIEVAAAPAAPPLAPHRAAVTFDILAGIGWRSAGDRGGLAAVVAADTWPAALGGRLGLRLHLDAWSSTLGAALPAGTRPSFQGCSVQAGVVGRAAAGPVQLSAGLTAGALRGAASSLGTSAAATTATGQLFAVAALPMRRGRLGLELSWAAGRWRTGGLEAHLGGPAALLIWSDELP